VTNELCTSGLIENRKLVLDGIQNLVERCEKYLDRQRDCAENNTENFKLYFLI
jgi:hypothetical protein